MMGLQGLQDKAKGHDPGPSTVSALRGGTRLLAPHFNECFPYGLWISKSILGFLFSNLCLDQGAWSN